ncbi:MAG: RidA family protein [Candidatus Saccharibacteria bacterium]
MKVEQKLAELGITLPEAPKPVAAYVPGVITGDLVFVSGQLPTVEGKLSAMGKIGDELTVKDGQKAARRAAINCLGVLKALLGDLDRVQQVVKLTGYVQSANDFYNQPQVVNGASELMQEVFGEKGQHARAAVGVNALPLNAPCEVELIVRISNEV